MQNPPTPETTGIGDQHSVEDFFRRNSLITTASSNPAKKPRGALLVHPLPKNRVNVFGASGDSASERPLCFAPPHDLHKSRWGMISPLDPNETVWFQGLYQKQHSCRNAFRHGHLQEKSKPAWLISVEQGMRFGPLCVCVYRTSVANHRQDG